MEATTAASPLASESFADSLARLRSAQKTSQGAPPYSLYVNRPLGRVIAAAAHRVGLTPNQVTAISAGFTFAAIVALALAPPTPVAGLLVALGLVLGYAFDAADGQLARLRGGGSTAGEWLDHVVDSAKTAALHLAVLVTVFRHVDLGSPLWLLVPIGFAVVATVYFFGMILNEQLARTHHARWGSSASQSGGAGGSPRWMSIAKLPSDYGLLCVSFVLLGAPVVFFGVYTVLALASLGHLALVLPKWYRDMVALDRRAAAQVSR